jgi:hypothetical protein
VDLSFLFAHKSRDYHPKLNIFDLLNVNAVCKITESHYMKHNLCVENFDFYHMIYEYLDDNHVIYAQKEKIDPRIQLPFKVK